MLTVTKVSTTLFLSRRARAATTRKPSPLTRFAGIGADAKALKVSRVHLYLVLSGKRPSPELIKDYQLLLRADGRRLPESVTHILRAAAKNKSN